MRFFLIFLLVVFVRPTFANECNGFIHDIESGDVASAEVLEEYMKASIEGMQSLEIEDLIGTWACTTYSSLNFSGDGWVNSDYGSFTERDVTVTEINSSSVLFEYVGSLGRREATTLHRCVVNFLGAEHIFLDDDGDHQIRCYDRGGAPIRRSGRFCMSIEIDRTTADQEAIATSCKKNSVPPFNPTRLEIQAGSNGNQLSWTAGDDTATSYRIMSKDAASDDFSELGTATGTNFTDGSPSASRQYRVFAINDNGMSIGSNVVSLD